MRTLKIYDTHDKFIKAKEVKDYDEAYDYIFDEYNCCWSVEDLGDYIEAIIYPQD